MKFLKYLPIIDQIIKLYELIKNALKKDTQNETQTDELQQVKKSI